MTTVADTDRSHESIINDTLARFLRERCSLSAVAETLHDGRRPGIIVRAVDPVRIELDERIVRDMLGLGEDAVTTVARLRQLLASDPSIHGSKSPELSS